MPEANAPSRTVKNDRLSMHASLTENRAAAKRQAMPHCEWERPACEKYRFRYQNLSRT
jgi:hypothetical protein